MDELKACPYCGLTPNPPYKDNDSKFWDNWHMLHICKKPGDKTGLMKIEVFGKTAELCIETWNRRAEPENKALTLDELKERDKQKVFVVDEETQRVVYGKVDVKNSCIDTGNVSDDYTFSFYGFGDTGFYGWLAYDRPPKEAPNNG